MSASRILKIGGTALAIFGVAVCIALAIAYQDFKSWSAAPLAIDEPHSIELQPGDTLTALAAKLAAANIEPQSNYLVLLGRVEGLAAALQAGEYAIEPGTTPLQLLNKMSRGEVIMHPLRFEEGHTVKQILQQLANDPRIQHVIKAKTLNELGPELGIQSPFIEGMFFPDTYFLKKGDTDKSLLLRAHNAMQTQLQEVWSKRGENIALTSATDALILASIIEKETGRADERFNISQVFHNRLRLGMRLQTDPTVIYGLGDSFDGNLTRLHLRTPSSHNTYVIKGLPPTPIALPSRRSLEAAVTPSSGDLLYFVARGDGSSKFSATLEQHNAAVQRYQIRRSKT